MFKEQLFYIQAQKLNQTGYQLTILEDHNKNPNYDDWQNNKWQNKYNEEEYIKALNKNKPFNMTGVGLIGGVINNLTGNYVYIIDIDIYQQDKRDEIFNKIIELFTTDNVYYETTPSGGYHIIFHCKEQIKTYKVYSFGGFNHKDKVEFFYNGQCLIAPSKAYKKDKIKNIGEYKQLSKTNLQDTIVLKVDEWGKFINKLELLSKTYDNIEFRHNYKTTTLHHEELYQLYNKLKTNYYCAPLYNGNKYNSNLDWKKEELINDDLTGIMIKLGKQKDKSYLVCLDFDNVKDDTLIDNIGHNTLVEKSVSGGYHIYFRLKSKLDVNVKWFLPNKGGNLDVLWMDNQTVNIAPTCAYTDNKKVSEPIYNTSEVLFGSFDNIKNVNTKSFRNNINNLIPCRKIIPNTQKYHFKSNSEEDQYMLQNIYEYGDINDIDYQIKLLYPSTKKLLDFLKIKRSNISSIDYIRFFSLYTFDGRHPDALLYHNRNKEVDNKWQGYSVQDFHSGEIISFAKYLCKYSPLKFDFLMNSIGFGKIESKTPISTTYLGDTLTIKYDKYISDDQCLEVMSAINNIISSQEGRSSQIVITAPTGCGKTEMFYKLAAQQKIKMILALAYTSQVLQGKENHTVPDILNGMCEKDYIVPDGSIFMTYDKADILYKSGINPKDYIMVIDEAHNIVIQDVYRKKQIHNLIKLSKKCKTVIYMTATPDYINYKYVNLMIKLEPNVTKIKSAIIVKYNEDSNSVLPNIIFKQHTPETVDIIYIKNINSLKKIESVINSKYPDIKTHLLCAENKNESDIYDNLSKYQNLTEFSKCNTYDFLFTTNLIVDGVNINDTNIGNIYLIDPDSPTDLVQFPARFRNGYLNYFIFITGKQPAIGKLPFSRQNQVEKYYNIAYYQKESFDDINNSRDNNNIHLIDQYNLLSENGFIQESTILFKVQQLEAQRMRSNINCLKRYLENSIYGYNFKVYEQLVKSLEGDYFTIDEISISNNSIKDNKTGNEITLIKILTEDIYKVLKNELIKDYLKSNKSNLFPDISYQYNIQIHTKTNKFNRLLVDKKCKSILYKWCTGIKLKAINILDLIDLSDKIVYSLERTYNNLSQNYIFLNNGDMTDRFIAVKDLVNQLRENNIYTINSDDIKIYIRIINKDYDKNLYSLNNISILVSDLHDIYDVEVKKNYNLTEYTIKDEWTFNNIRGVKFLVES